MAAPPVPKPRTNIDSQSKKPIPKPRQKGLSAISISAAPLNESEEFCSKCNCVQSEGCVCVRSDVSKQSSTDTCGRSKFSADSKRIVGARLEKSVRNITRRFTTRPLSPNKGSNDPKILRSHSLPSEDVLLLTPSEDIFKTISFKSPITPEIEPYDPLSLGVGNEDGESDLFMTYSAPPPVYPPPPLPDESTYDEVHSVANSVSGSSIISTSSSGVTVPKKFDCGTTATTGAVYEPIAIDSPLDCIGKDSFSKPIVLPKANITQTPSIKVSNSDSWAFYDTVFSEKQDREDNVSLSADVSTKDTISLMSGASYNRNSISPSLLSELDALGCISEDEDIDTFCDDQSSASSLPRSISVQNEMYDNWEPLKKFEPIVLRKKENVRNLPSKSVILEFDPLYSCGAVNEGTEHSATNIDSLTSNTPLYGNVRVLSGKGGKKRNSYDEVAIECPPVPPRRHDSISNSTQSVCEPEITGRNQLASSAVCEIASTEQNVLFKKAGLDGPKQALSVCSLQKTVSFEDISGDKGKQSGKLPRLQSMRKVVQKVADSTSNWSPNIIRRGGKLGLPVWDQRRSAQVFPDKQSKMESSSNVKDHVTIVERPEIPQQLNHPYSGLLYKVAVGKERAQDFVQRWCVLAEDKLTFYADKNASAVKEVIVLNSILSLQLVLDHKINIDGDCFEINVPNKSASYIFGTSGPSERRMWMQKILESLTASFPLRVISDYSRSGWCYLKEGISGKWSSAWILIHQRLFYYCFPNMSIQEVDLRKARCVALQDSGDVICSLQVSVKGPTVLVDCQGLALYLCMDTVDETKVWQKIIRNSAIDNGPNLDQQQLTKDDLPVIVDKCIKFVFAHGSMSEGIYRRSGANTSVTKLLKMFRSDAWSVQLSRQDYTEYDVSSVLKRFFRDIPDSLLTTELHGQFCDIAAGKCNDNKVASYRRALEQLPPVNYLTTRKLIGHLHSIHEQREKNRMPIENLAAIWGPTLMHVETSESLEWSKLETAVVAELISYHVQLFEVDSEELKREKQMQEVLERINASITSQPQSKQSGELLVWIYLNNRDSGNCVHITVGPQKQAGEVCKDLAPKINIASHELVLQEVVCNGSLVRYLHHSEKVLDTVLRWSYWDECDRKDNGLVLMKNDVLKEVAPLTKQPHVSSGELRFADRKNKSFKPYVFEFSQAKLCYYKDKKGSIKLNEWKIEDIVWYLGYEKKRNPQTRWAITFIEKNGQNNRSKECPHFGNTIAGTSKDEQLRWMAALLIGEYPQGILMSPSLLT